MLSEKVMKIQNYRILQRNNNNKKQTGESSSLNRKLGALVVMISWWFDLQLPMKSVPINNNIWNPIQARYT
jgi:hypothetical protein